MSESTETLMSLETHFQDMADAIGVYINNNKGTMTSVEVNQLFDQKMALLDMAGEINMKCTSAIFDDAEGSMKNIEEITGGVKQAVAKALKVQDAINLASSLVSLAGAIISCQPKAIATKVAEAGHALKLV